MWSVYAKVNHRSDGRNGRQENALRITKEEYDQLIATKEAYSTTIEWLLENPQVLKMFFDWNNKKHGVNTV